MSVLARTGENGTEPRPPLPHTLLARNIPNCEHPRAVTGQINLLRSNARTSNFALARAAAATQLWASTRAKGNRTGSRNAHHPVAHRRTTHTHTRTAQRLGGVYSAHAHAQGADIKKILNTYGSESKGIDYDGFKEFMITVLGKLRAHVCDCVCLRP